MSDLPFKRVLVIDDEPSYRALVERYISSLGYQCGSARDAVEALGKLNSQAYDLVISDIQMPGMDGIQLMKEVGSNNSAVSFILMTGYASDYSYSEIIEAGAADYLTKPFEIGELKAKIQRIERELGINHRLKSSNDAYVREWQLNAVMAELFRALIASEPVEYISELVLKCGREITASACGWVTLVDSASGKMFMTAVSNGTETVSFPQADPAFRQSCQPLHDRFESDRSPIKENSLIGEEGLSLLSPAHVPIKRFLAVPVGLGDTLIGSIALANSDRDYTEIDVRMVGQLAEEYGLAILHKRHEESMVQAKEYIERIFDSTADAIFIIDKHGRVVKWNKRGAALFFDKLKRLENTKIFDHYADKEKLEEMLTLLRRDGFVRRYEIDMLKGDGAVLPCELSINLLRSAVGETLGSVGVVRDMSEIKKSLIEARNLNERLQKEIAERKSAEEEIRKVHAEIAQLVASIPSILIGLSGEQRVIWWNETAEEIFGLKRADVLGRLLDECGLPWNRQRVREGLSRCSLDRAQIRLDDINFSCSNGKDGFLGISISPMGDFHGENCGFIIMASDITERKIMDSQLVQAQKLESIGQLAAGIAHEINTPTQYVGDNTRFLQDAFRELIRLLERYAKASEEFRAGVSAEELIAGMQAAVEKVDLDYLIEEIPKAIEQSLEGVNRVSKIVRAMKEFSHPGAEEKTAIDINRAIESTVTVARNEWKYVADMVMDFDPDLPLTPCLPGEFNQLILNMIINAVHAISDVIDRGSGEKGTINISTRLRGNMVEIRLSDTGAGVPEAIRARIFDPFFTTKEVGKGTGQGLAISRSVIVDKLGGTIALETGKGQGAAFVVCLPITGSAV